MSEVTTGIERGGCVYWQWLPCVCPAQHHPAGDGDGKEQLQAAAFAGVGSQQGGDAVTPEMLLIPCNGFDARGFRLGYGAGHYDRTLAAMQPMPCTVGIAIEDGRIDDLGPEPHDIPMDWIVTEAGAFETRR